MLKSLAQESEVRVPFNLGHGQKVIALDLVYIWLQLITITRLDSLAVDFFFFFGGGGFKL